MVETKIPKAAPGNYNSIAAQYARAKAIKDAEDLAKAGKLGKGGKEKTTLEKLNDWKRARFGREWWWVMVAFLWFLCVYSLKLLLLHLYDQVIELC
jgi:phosphatidylinositol glycan class O